MVHAKVNREFACITGFGRDMVGTVSLSDQLLLLEDSGTPQFRFSPLTEIDFSASMPLNDKKANNLFNHKAPNSFEFENNYVDHLNYKEEDENDRHRFLLEFEEICPPGGEESVVLYTTSLGVIRKTFEDCNTIRFLLESFHIAFDERDVAMHLEFREEMWKIMGGKVVPPRLFIRGRHIGGADEVVELHEQGKFRKLLHGSPLVASVSPCSGCGGVRFLLCFNCNGSCKITSEGEEVNEQFPIRCPECNENGLVKCPICC